MKIKLRVQIVVGITLSDEDIKFNLQDVNAIFEQCRIRFNVILTIRNVVGNASNVDSRNELREKMGEGLEQPPFSGSGAGITVTGPLNDDPNKHGETGVGHPSTVVVESDENGETWAHELAHGLGLFHNGTDTDGNKEDDSFDPDLDGTPNTVKDRNNLMWPGTDTRLNNELTDTQCKILQENAKKIGQTVLNDEQTRTSLDGNSYIEKTYDYAVDDKNEPTVEKDLFYASVFAIEPFEEVSIQWTSALLTGSEILDMDYIFAMDSDNNQSSGIEYGGVLGIDLVLDVWLEGGNMVSSNKWPTLYNYLTDQGEDISAEISFNNITLDASTYIITTEISPIPIETRFDITLNKSLLGNISPIVPAFFMISYGGTDDFVNVTYHSIPEMEPRIYSSKLQTWNGDSLDILGQNFSPNTAITLSFNDAFIGTASSNNIGNFSYPITTPNLDLGSYYLEAVDEDGNLGFLIFEIIEDLNPNTVTASSGTSSGTTHSSTPNKNDTGSNQTSPTYILPFTFLLFTLSFVFILYPIKRNKTMK